MNKMKAKQRLLSTVRERISQEVVFMPKDEKEPALLREQCSGQKEWFMKESYNEKAFGAEVVLPLQGPNMQEFQLTQLSQITPVFQVHSSSFSCHSILTVSSCIKYSCAAFSPNDKLMCHSIKMNNWKEELPDRDQSAAEK